MESFWGVDHGEEISKGIWENKKSTPGRKVTAALLGGTGHGAFAGRKGKKLRAFGNEFGGAVAGSTVGSMAGQRAGMLAMAPMARKNPIGAAFMPAAGVGIGAMSGNYAGALAGLARNERKGYMKPQKRR